MKESVSNTKTDKNSMIFKFSLCVLYGSLSSLMTYVNKSIYTKFKFESPLDVSSASHHNQLIASSSIKFMQLIDMLCSHDLQRSSSQGLSYHGIDWFNCFYFQGYEREVEYWVQDGVLKPDNYGIRSLLCQIS